MEIFTDIIRAAITGAIQAAILYSLACVLIEWAVTVTVNSYRRVRALKNGKRQPVAIAVERQEFESK